MLGWIEEVRSMRYGMKEAFFLSKESVKIIQSTFTMTRMKSFAALIGVVTTFTFLITSALSPGQVYEIASIGSWDVIQSNVDLLFALGKEGKQQRQLEEEVCSDTNQALCTDTWNQENPDGDGADVLMTKNGEAESEKQVDGAIETKLNQQQRLLMKLMFPVTHYIIYTRFANRQWKLSSYLLNLVNHFFLVTLSAIGIWKRHEIYENRFFGYLKEAEVGATWFKYYLIYDTFKMIVGGNTDVLQYIHHLLAGILFHISHNDSFGFYYFPTIGLFEFSSIFLVFRDILFALEVEKENRWIKVSELLFVLSFVCVRVIFAGPDLVEAIMHLDYLYNEGQVDLFWRHYIYPSSMLYAFMAIHLYWLIGISRKIRKMLI